MPSPNVVTNVVFAGLGGQGVLKASDITASAALQSGFDVKKSELHGMSQRGGSVTSDVRFGDAVISPMCPPGEADFLVVLSPDQIEINLWLLKPGGTLIDPSLIDTGSLENKKSLNIALLGVLSTMVDIREDCWVEAIRSHLDERHIAPSLSAFAIGRSRKLVEAVQ